MSATPKAPVISVVIEDPNWRKDGPALRLIRRAVKQALTSPVALVSRGGEGAALSVTLLLTDDAKLRALNGSFRGKDKPTNVLAFPAADASYLGDIALAHGVVKREAREQGKNFAHHAAHLALHGTLHLLGYDHESAGEARAMETLETALLERLEIADPYAPRLYTRPRKKA